MAGDMFGGGTDDGVLLKVVGDAEPLVVDI
jgi:hypothetical protein